MSFTITAPPSLQHLSTAAASSWLLSWAGQVGRITAKSKEAYTIQRTGRGRERDEKRTNVKKEHTEKSTDFEKYNEKSTDFEKYNEKSTNITEKEHSEKSKNRENHHEKSTDYEKYNEKSTNITEKKHTEKSTNITENEHTEKSTDLEKLNEKGEKHHEKSINDTFRDFYCEGLQKCSPMKRGTWGEENFSAKVRRKCEDENSKHRKGCKKVRYEIKEETQEERFLSSTKLPSSSTKLPSEWSEIYTFPGISDPKIDAFSYEASDPKFNEFSKVLYPKIDTFPQISEKIDAFRFSDHSFFRFPKSFNSDCLKINNFKCSKYLKSQMPPLLLESLVEMVWLRVGLLIEGGGTVDGKAYGTANGTAYGTAYMVNDRRTAPYQILDWVRTAPVLLDLASRLSQRKHCLDLTGIQQEFLPNTLSIIKHFNLDRINKLVLPRVKYKNEKVNPKFSPISFSVIWDILKNSSFESLVSLSLGSNVSYDGTLSLISQLTLQDLKLEIPADSESEKRVIGEFCNFPVSSTGEALNFIRNGGKFKKTKLGFSLRSFEISLPNVPAEFYCIFPFVFNLQCYRPNMKESRCILMVKGILNECKGVLNESEPLNYPLDFTLEHPLNLTLEHPLNPTLEHPLNLTLEHPLNPTLEHPLNPTLEHPLNPTLEHPLHDTLDYPLNDPLNSTLKHPLHDPLDYSLKQPLNDPLNSTLKQPLNSTLKQPLNQLLRVSLGRSTSSEIAQINTICPNLNAISMNVEINAEENFRKIALFGNITELNLTYYPSLPISPPKQDGDIILPVLSHFRNKLYSLSLTGFNLRENVMIEIASLPELRVLKLAESWLASPKVMPESAFRSLESLTLKLLPSDSMIRLLISDTVEHIDFEFVASEWEGNALTDTHITHLVQSGVLRSIQSFSATSPYLTLASLKTLARLPLLRSVGRLSLWGLKDEELRCISHSGPSHLFCLL